jgi:hypothetical protein
VKRRKLHDEDAAAALQHLNLVKSRIRRARVFNDPLTGGFFAREYGAVESDMQTACFIEGLRDKGSVEMSGGGPATDRIQVDHMYVGGQDYRTGMCTAYVGMSFCLFFVSLFLGAIPEDKIC